MRFRVPLLFLVCVAGTFVLPTVAHAGIPFFGPIIPQTAELAVCAANWGLVITVVNNIISLLLTLAIVFVAPITIAYAGFLYVVNPVSPAGISKAKGILQNTVTGIVVALAAWLIVDAIMATLYHPTDPRLAGKTWQQLITRGGVSECIPIAGSLNQVAPGARFTNFDPSGRAVLSFDPNAASSGACSAAALQQVVPSLTTAEANTFACLAKYESSCGTRPANYNWGSGSSAYGPFQILLDSNHQVFENPSCYAAAGVSGPLNCQNGFSRGNPIPGNQTAELCKRAASNLNCSAAAAYFLKKKQGFGAWTADNSATSQKQCIAKYSP